MISAERPPQDSLCNRLRRERERRQIAISSISANTKISASLFAALERGDISKGPAGIFRRSFIRAYAQAIGLDPDSVAREFLEQFPDPADPAPGPPVASIAVSGEAGAAHAERAGLRLKLADSPTPFMSGRILDGLRSRLAAVAYDGGVVSALALCMFIAFDRFWLPLGVTMIGYYVGGILLLGNTPGVCLLAPEPNGEPSYNRATDDDSAADANRPTHSPWHLGLPAR